MSFSLHSIFLIIEQYKYLVIFPIMIVEGPIITIISGFLTYLGFLNFLILYPILILGDLSGDCIYYYIGRNCDKTLWIKKFMSRLGYNEEKEKFLIKHFEKHTIKTLATAKISHGLGIPVQITAGIARVNFFKYFGVELVGTMLKTLFLLIIGFYIGNSYLKINNYLHFFATTLLTIAVLIILYLISSKYIKSYLKKD